MIGSRAFRPLVAAPRVAQQASQRRFGHWLHKHPRVEENAGLRENSIATWTFNTNSVGKLLGYIFVPGALFYVVCIDELDMKHKQMGSKQTFGATPGKKSMDEDA